MGRQILGVVGGMGPLATVAFLRALAIQTDASRDQDHLHVLVESDPTIPDRTAFLLGEGKDPRPAMIRVARRLESAGATLLVIPCNTANVFAADVRSAVGVPLLDWTGVAARAAAGNGRTVGLLATTGTIQSGIYQRLLESNGAAAVAPSPPLQRDVMDAIYGSCGVKTTGSMAPEVQERVLAVAADLVHHGADCLLLGCTELPLGIEARDPRWPVPTLDPAVVVARAAIRAAGGPFGEDGAAKDRPA